VDHAPAARLEFEGSALNLHDVEWFDRLHARSEAQALE
jgi:hypothetical protein